MAPRSRHLVMLAGSAGLVLAACALLYPPGEDLVPGRAARFPHSVHLAQDMACTDCHVTALEEAAAGMPSLELCRNCHDEAQEAEKPAERTPAGFILPGAEEPTWTSVTSFALEVSFSHARHGAAGVECAECHGDVAEADAVSRSFSVGMDRCVSCHEEREVSEGGCAGCHPGVDTRSAPATHDERWLRAHGMLGAPATAAASPAVAGSAMNCALCHQESECATCHRRMEPADHSEPWRVRGHGFAAALERDRCLTCHREDSCARCHRETEPLSHRGAWASGMQLHCGSCHVPLSSDESCAVCHADTRGHRAAPPRPPPPHPGAGADCRLCHFPVPHFDNGQECTLCHR